MKKTILVMIICGLLLASCEQTPPAVEQPAVTPTESAPGAPPPSQPAPPTPPLFEDFQGEPQISLFPRVGPARPEQDDDSYPFWATYLDHLKRTSGVSGNNVEVNRAFSIRSIKGLDSVGWFSPMAVEPGTSYRVSAKFLADLPEGATCGIGVIEYDRFLWIGDQFTRQQIAEHQRDARILITLSGKFAWQPQGTSFTTGSDTRMIHLLLFRDGPDGKEPVLFDDVRIEKEESPSP